MQEQESTARATPFTCSNKDWIGAIQGLGGVNAVFDPLGYESFDESYSILHKGGILVAYGMNRPALTKTPRHPALPVILKLFARNLVFWSGKQTTFVGLRRESKNYIPDFELLFNWLASGKIAVPIKAVFRLDQIRNHGVGDTEANEVIALFNQYRADIVGSSA